MGSFSETWGKLIRFAEQVNSTPHYIAVPQWVVDEIDAVLSEGNGIMAKGKGSKGKGKGGSKPMPSGGGKGQKDPCY